VCGICGAWFGSIEQLDQHIGASHSDPAPVLADPVNHPPHYTSHPSGIECIQVTEHYNFCIGNAIKYLWRAGLKSDDPTQDLRKAVWYIERELDRLSRPS